MNNKENTVTPSPEQIAAWKNEHGEVNKLTSTSGKVVYLRNPNRADLSFAAAAGAQDPLKFNQAILDNCWLGGHEEVKTSDSLFMGISAKISELIRIEEFSLEKL